MTFKHGVMHSSKTAQLLMEAHNYRLQDKEVLGLKPSTDTRTQEGVIKSRTPLDKLPCIMIDEADNITDALKDVNLQELSCIMIDEAQFLTPQQVYELHVISTTLEVDIIAYGLKNSYIEGQLFDGSASLLFYADSIEEIKTVCYYCRKKATQNLRLVNDIPVYEGDQIEIGDTKGVERYVQVCNKHYFKGGVD